MNKTDSLRFNRLFWVTGLVAIVVGASLAAFTAKSPTTLTVWASAYLVLVVGLAQIGWAVAVVELIQKSVRRSAVWVYGLFNLGNILTLASTSLKYSDFHWHQAVTVLGALLITGSMIILGWLIRKGQKSWLKTGSYALLTLLIISALFGVVLAGQF